VRLKGSSSIWPFIIRTLSFIGLCAVLSCFLIGIAVLDDFARRRGLTRTAFLYETSLSFLTASPFSFSPISIIPTLFAIGVGLWWGAIQESVCFLQPYVSLCRQHGTPLSVAGSLYYNPAHWPTSFLKALRNRHWRLILIIGGTILCQLRKHLGALVENSILISSSHHLFFGPL
jgi:hypothetical protein